MNLTSEESVTAEPTTNGSGMPTNGSMPDAKVSTLAARRRRVRRKYGRIREVVDMPHLIEVQQQSYDMFLHSGNPDNHKDREGLRGVFQSVFPIRDYNETCELAFVDYKLESPKFDIDECQKRDITYAAPLKVKLRLIVFDDNDTVGVGGVKDIKEQEVFMGEMPLMTENGTFIIKGTERVVVSQMHRSPGLFFDHDKGKNSSGRELYHCRIIPYRGSWIDFEFDTKDLVNVRIDKKKKMPVSTLLYALGLDQETILGYFYPKVICRYSEDKDKFRGWVAQLPFDEFKIKNEAPFDLIDADTGEVYAEREKPVKQSEVDQLNQMLSTTNLLLPPEFIDGHFLAEDLIDEKTGLVLAEAGDSLDAIFDIDGSLVAGNVLDLINAGIREIPILYIDGVHNGPYIRNTLAADKNSSRMDALFDIYKALRPGEPVTEDAAEFLFQQLFSDPNRYDLSAVGRVKMNMRLGLDVDDSERTLRTDDILACVKAMVGLRDGIGEVDDIDHLGNRRVRSVGESLENSYRIGLMRMSRLVKERMATVEIDNVMPQDLVNSKPASATVREFFGSSQLSQFMDQTNPLSEITHKRRLSALGPGGLTRERAGFEVRDVHPTHYGRICPVETPEGPNIGLINSLATFAKVNKYGFIETPYRLVNDGQVTDETRYITATEEKEHRIAQANAQIDASGRLEKERVNTRVAGEVKISERKDVDMIDVTPKQLVSVAASLIPFLENDDANRALMGSNMQRQAVPLLRSEAPFVGTGIESKVAKDSGAAITARRAGIIDQVDATRIVISVTEELEKGDAGVDIYRLRKFQRSNQNTCINQRPLVNVGDQVVAGEVIADGPSTDLGELALGRNVLVAFMPWNGYNFEDSILISERIARDDVFTSVHIDEFEVDARDTKLGPEAITRDIPNVSNEALNHLDDAGIVHIGAKVGPGDILVGKITPKGDTPMTPEEKLLRAIFGENAADVRDTSLRLRAGDYGTVVEVRVFHRHGIEKDDRAIQIEREAIADLTDDRDDERKILERNVFSRLRKLLVGKVVVKGPKGPKALPQGTVITEEILDRLTYGQWWQLSLEDEDAASNQEALKSQFEEKKRALEDRFKDKVEKARRGDDLPAGVMSRVKVFTAVKRKLQPGDKMAGRHGNKGVVSKVVPIEDMPFLEDGTPVDIVLNPLGVPSRMNVGQILETHLGWAARGFGLSVNKALEEYKRDEQRNAESVRCAMRKAYGEATWKEEFANMSDDELIATAHNIASGVPVSTPVFDGAKEQDVTKALEEAGWSGTGQVELFDGQTGEPFARPVTVGMKYLLKLHHLVDDKIHARSTGPYSLVTQQPLGGKAQFGGQRFGEMEVWALEAYGAAYTLQEMLTVKADDVKGRKRVYEAIVKGDDNFTTGIPESFNVLVHEVRGLGLNMELISHDTA